LVYFVSIFDRASQHIGYSLKLSSSVGFGLVARLPSLDLYPTCRGRTLDKFPFFFQLS
jgi:hypothetical protein